MKSRKLMKIFLFLAVNAAVCGYWLYDIVREKAYDMKLVAQVERAEGVTGDVIEVPVRVTNIGAIYWFKNGAVKLSYHIADPNSEKWIVDGDGERTNIHKTLHRGHSLDMKLKVRLAKARGEESENLAPGDYILLIEPVNDHHKEEYRFWFRQKNVKMFEIPLTVLPAAGGDE